MFYMAAGPTTSVGELPEEERNCLVFCHLTTKVGIPALRIFFDRIVPPTSLATFLNSHITNLQNLLKRKIMFLSQHELLFPQASPVTSVDFDITLMVCLIRNLFNNVTPPTTGWDALPNPTDLTEEADIVRIKYYRNNFLAHRPVAEMSNVEFNIAATDVRAAISRLSNTSLDAEVQKILDMTGISSQDLKAFQEEFDSLKEERDNLKEQLDDLKKAIPEHIKGQHTFITETWRKDEATFVSTRAAESLHEKIRTTNCVTVTGNSGSGKSAAVHHVAIQLEDLGYDIIPVNDILDVQKYCNVSRKQVFVLDDPIGTMSINEYALNTIESVSQNINSLLTSNTSNTKIMVTCRKIIVQSPKFAVSMSFLRNTIFDLNNETHSLSECERKQILDIHTNHLKKELTNDEKNLIVQQNSEQLPMLCKMFGANEKYQELGNSFFNNMFSSMVQEIHSLQHNDKLKYCCLILCLLFDNDFDSKMLDPFVDASEINQRRIQNIKQACGLQIATPNQDIKSALGSLRKVYLIQERTRFQFMHDSLYEATACQFGKEYPIEVLNHCSSRFIRERIRIAPFETNDDSHFIVLDAEYTDILSKRLVLEMERGNFHDVFLSSFIEDKVIQESIKGVLCTYSADEIFRYAFDIDVNAEKYDKFVARKGELYFGKLSVLQDRRLKMFHWLLAQNMTLVFRFIHEKIKHHKRYSTEHIVLMACLSGNIALTKDVLLQRSLSETFTFKGTSLSTLHMAVLSNNPDMVRYVMQNTDVSISMSLRGHSPLHLAAYNGTIDIISVMKQHGADVNLCSYKGVSPLYMAAQNGHVEVVSVLVQHGADVNLCNNDDVSPLYCAAHKGHVEVVSVLVQHGADVNVCRNDGVSPLYISAQNGHVEVVSVLVQHGADVNLCDNDDVSPLYIAAQNGHVEVVSVLILHGADVNLCNNKGVSPLYIAAGNGHVEVVSVLVQHGADVNLCSNGGVSPLCIAANEGHVEGVSVLILHGADVNLCNNKGVSPLYIAAGNGHVEVVSVLVQHGADVNLCNNDDVSLLYMAAESGHVEVVSVLVQHGADVNLCKNNGVSPLYIAAQNGHVEVVSVLIQIGADVNLCRNDGASPLCMAAKNGHVEVVSVLIQHDANVNLCDNDGISPLYIATENGHVEVVSVLVQHGADVNLCKNNGVSPLYIAAHNGHVEVVSVLVQHGADFNLCDNDGVSLLYIAAQNGHVEVVSVLLQHEADVNLCNNVGISPLYIAVYNGHVEVVSVLLQHGADVNLCRKVGVSPLMIASYNGHALVVQKLLHSHADVNVVDKDGDTALSAATDQGHTEIVEMLQKCLNQNN